MMKNFTNEIKQKEMQYIIVARINRRVVKEGRGERQVDQTIELLMATALTEQNTVRNPISIVHDEEERIMIYMKTIILLLRIGQEEEMM
mmetsp:Transcript_2720/g.4125  ORF Transcript_2720/g.4125 Transcript_2720/m.4125 type:complete len:89 (-) Transcript_2720:152-418(-)